MRPALGGRGRRGAGEVRGQGPAGPGSAGDVGIWPVGHLELLGGHCQGTVDFESSFILEGLTCHKDHHTGKDFESKNQPLGCVFSAPLSCWSLGVIHLIFTFSHA